MDASFVTDGDSCGLYLLDEPEAALSPMRQLTFIAALKQIIQENSQFIIATHFRSCLHSPMRRSSNFPTARFAEYNTTNSNTCNSQKIS